MECLDHVLVFKTDIMSARDVLQLKPVLDHHTEIIKWTVDTEDQDCVLRVISYTFNCRQVIELINHHGYQCCELT